MADGTINVVLNLPEDCIPQAKVLMDWLKLEIYAYLSLDRIDGTQKAK